MKLVTGLTPGVYSLARHHPFGGTVPWAEADCPGGAARALSLFANLDAKLFAR